MTTEEKHAETFEADVPPPSPSPPLRERTGSAMASFAQWEEQGKGPSGATILGIAFSAGVIALGVLLVKSGVLAPRPLAEIGDPIVKRGWAPLHDVSTVGAPAAVGALAAEAPASTPPEQSVQAPATARAPATPSATDTASPQPGAATKATAQHPQPERTTRSTARPTAHTEAARPTGEADPYAHLEESAASAPAARMQTARPVAPVVESAPRIIGEKNTTAQPEPTTRQQPTPPPHSTAPNPLSPGKSTWGGERTSPAPQPPPYEPPKATGPGKSTWGGDRTPAGH